MTNRRKLTYSYGPKHVLRINVTPIGIFVHLEPKKIPTRGGYKTPSWRFPTFKAAS